MIKRTVAAALAVFLCAALGHARPRAQGCSLSGAAMGGGGGIQLIWPSGNRMLDESFQAEGMLMVRVFGLSPRMFFFDDGNAPNAMATSQVVNQMGPHGTLLIGLSLVQSELADNHGEAFSLVAILAHEFAHLLQFSQRVQAPTPVMELQADFIAGWYLGFKSRFMYMDVQDAFRAFFSRGDYEFNSPNHHGTPEQRLAAIQSGFAAASQGADLRQAFMAGGQFAVRLMEGRGAMGDDGSGGFGGTDNGPGRGSPPPVTAPRRAERTNETMTCGQAAEFFVRNRGTRSFCSGEDDRSRYTGPLVSLSGVTGTLWDQECREDELAEAFLVYEGLTVDQVVRELQDCAESVPAGAVPKLESGGRLLVMETPDSPWVLVIAAEPKEVRRFVGGKWVSGIRVDVMVAKHEQ
ncbi:MAG TPA: hypothetical protein VD862_00955 [Candidatus Paceibacterota bacterium]|nr:hypothetical protein [Candidatus Paceibacterota bacterium]